MKYRKSNSLYFIARYIILLFSLNVFLLPSCVQKKNSDSNSVERENSTIDSEVEFNWTGTYSIQDGEIIYTLKLHKRSVDGSYELQWYDNSAKSELYKSSIYDAKPLNNSILIRYLNNFQMDASALGYKSGDTLFVLSRTTHSTDSTIWKKFQPTDKAAQFIKISDTY